MKEIERTVSLHQRVADQLRDHIQTHCRPGQKIESLRELAVKLKVCHGTLRAAQSLLRHEGLLEIRHGSGVYVANRAHERRIGIYSESDLLQSRTSSYHIIKTSALRRYFMEQGATAEVYLGTSVPGEKPDRPTNRRFLDDVAAGRLDGVVFTSESVTDAWREWNKQFPLPFVGSDWSPYRVEIDVTALIREGVRQLVTQGCRRLALLSWSSHMAEFSAALAAHGLDARPGWERHDLEPFLPGAGWEEFREIWSACAEKPDGLLVTDDCLAADAAVALQELGIRVPAQLRLVIQTNKGSGLRFPFPVTRLEIDPVEQGRALGAMLLDLLNGRTVETPKKLLQARVVVDERVGAKPAGPPAVDPELAERVGASR